MKPTQESRPCRNHPTIAGAWECEYCHARFCDQCVEVRGIAEDRTGICRLCGGRCRAAAAGPVPGKIPPGPFLKMLRGAFAYPFNGSGKYMLVGYAIILVAVGFLSIFPIVGLLARAASFILGLYVSAYMVEIIGSSAGGDDELPDWPDIANVWEDIIRPVALIVGPTLLCLGPWVIGLSGLVPLVLPLRALACLLGAAGIAYLPMALLAVAVHDSIVAMNPVTVVLSILKVPGDYVVACLVLAAVFGGFGLIAFVPYLGQVIASVLGLYLMAVGMHVLGLLYYANRAKLAWFPE